MTLNRWTSPDTIIPDPYNPQDFDRYAYSRNNPIRYSDPSGHNIFDTVGQFVRGFVAETDRSLVGYSPQLNNFYGPNSSESDAVLVGRLAADVVQIVVGVAAIGSGSGMGMTGVAACATGVGCPGGIVVMAEGVAVIGIGAVATTQGAIGLGGNFALFAGKTQGHHPWPKYLLGSEDQKLYNLDSELHSEYHSQLDKYLSRKYGTDNYVKLIDTREKINQLLEFLMDFNKDFDKTYNTHTYEMLEDVLRDEGYLPKPK